MVVVDSSVFSLFLRRNAPESENDIYRKLLHELLEKDQVVLLGIVYQELLSGIKTLEQFNRLNDILIGFDIIFARQTDHQQAAEFYNVCRQNGVQGSSIDFLICAMADNRSLPILTTDKDFLRYSKYIGIDLLSPP